MDFLKEFDKVTEKLETVTSVSTPPKYWCTSGNYVLNKIMSGSYLKCVPQGRILGLCGPSGAGKSFIAANIIAEMQKIRAFNVAIDSENALDDDFVSKIGVNTKDKYTYRSVSLISDVTALVSALIKGYKNKYGGVEDAMPLHITIDSMDMLLTDTEEENYKKGVSKGDQGQRNKQLKAMLRTFVQSIKGSNISMVVTGQVYANQDLLNGKGKWVVSEATEYALSQIVLIDKLKLKDKDDNKVIKGIRMICTGFKTRFTQPHQKVTIEVPYETGMTPTSGMLEIAVDLGVVKQGGAWYTLVESGEKFQKKTMEKHVPAILAGLEAHADEFVNRQTLGGDEEMKASDIDEESSKKKRDAMHLKDK